ncbi:MAG: ABC transporter permease [Dehalococcoidaceae bacterium]|nr:ABC transporter permease [Dehalococcoidaceae bacterium]
MNARIIGALIQKDLALAMRNRFFAVVLVLGLVAYTAVYLFMPSQVDEDIDFGLVAQLPSGIIEQLESGEGLRVHMFDSADGLKTAIEGGEIMGGLSLPDDFITDITSGVPVSASLYYSSATPEEYRSALNLMLSEIAYTIAGKPLNVVVNTTVLGRDTSGSPIAPRDTLMPLFAVFIILTEMMSLASLLSEEIETRTIRALMVTPMNIRGLFLAKGITGTGMAFFQAVVFMAIVGGLGTQTGLVLLTLLLGAVMAAGIGFLVAAAGRDLMSVMAWGVLFMLVFSVPAFGVIFPGSISGWVQAIPSFYLVDTLNQAVNYGSSWGDLWTNLVWLAGFNAAFIILGMWIVRRKLG